LNIGYVDQLRAAFNLKTRLTFVFISFKCALEEKMILEKQNKSFIYRYMLFIIRLDSAKYNTILIRCRRINGDM
jgi:hypothetical protein